MAADPGGEVVRSHKFAAKTTAGRKRQLGNLKPDGAVKTGVYSQKKLGPLREQFFAELTGLYPGVSETQRRTLAERQAMAELAAAFLTDRGIVRHQRRGEPYPIAALLTRLLDSIDRQIAAFEAQRHDTTADESLTAEVAKAREIWERTEARLARAQDTTDGDAVELQDGDSDAS